MSQKKITKQQIDLVDYLLADEKQDQTKAAIKAGYSPKTASAAAARALKLDCVVAYMNGRIAERNKRLRIDADYVLKRLTEMDELDVADLFDDEGNLLPIKQWPAAWRRTIKGIDLSKGKVILPDKLAVITQIGRHTGVRAFVDQLEVEDRGGFADRLAKARAKLEGESK